MSDLGPRSNVRGASWRFLTAGQGIAGSNRPSRLLSYHENLSSRTGGH
jgi:hypothetical protein